MRIYKVNEIFRRKCEVFRKKNARPDDIINAGEVMLSIMFKGYQDESLDYLRYKIFSHKVTSTKTYIKPEQLPPTSSSAKYHSLRVYCQIQTWLCNDIDPEKWGWERINTSHRPLLSDLNYAPGYLLEIIHCAFKSGCKTLRCTCKKNGLECTSACCECRGFSCENVKILNENDAIYDSEDIYDVKE